MYFNQYNKIKKSVFISTSCALFFCAILSGQVNIVGPSTANIGDIQTYSLSSSVGTDILWFIASSGSDAVITGTSSTAAQVRFDENGTAIVSATVLDDTTVLYNLSFSVTVSGGIPDTPNNPTIETNTCGAPVLRRSGSPGNGETWYWQGKTSNGTFTNKGSGFTFTANEGNGTYYIRARNISGQWSPGSGSISVTVNNLQPGSITGADDICSGTDPDNLASLSLATNGDGTYAYQWQVSSDNSNWSDVSGATVSSYNPTTNLTSDRWYRRKVSSCGQVAYTASEKITVIGALAAPTGASTVEGCEYGNLNVSLTPASGGNTIRWYTSPTGGTHIDQGTLSLTDLVIGSVYYGSTYNNAGCESSARKQVTIVAAPTNNCGAPDSGSQSTFISGDTNMFVGEERTYTMTPPSNLGEIVWTIPSSKGEIISASNAYSVTIRFNAPGEFNIGVSGRDLNASSTTYLSSSLAVFVVGPPPPPLPIQVQNACGEVILGHNGTPDTGIRWYWQGQNSTSKSTSLGYVSEFTANAGIGTYYLRSYHVASQSWSATPSSRQVTTIEQFTGGSIAFYSNASNQVCYNSDPPDLVNSDLPDGRITTDTTYSWEYADSASGPWNPAGETDGFYYDPPSGLIADRWYRRKVTSCNGEIQYSNVLMVEVSDSMQAPQGATSYGICPGGTLDIDLTVGSGNVVRWYINQTTTNHLAEGVLTLSGANVGSSFYASSYNTTSGCESARVLVNITAEPLANCANNGPDLGTDPDISLTISGDNYVYTRGYQTGQATAPNFFTEDDNLIQQITYFDGVGRGIQQIGMDHSPQKQDIVTYMEYDDYGRTPIEYLPYASSQGTMGSFKTGDLASINTWYDVLKYENTQNPFSEKEFEQSPLNRVYKQAAPGNDWAMGQGNEIEFGYETNTAADNVRQFEVSLAVNGDTYVPTLVENSTNLEYGAGELFKSVTKDENHTSGNDHTTEEFTNKQGQVVLKRTYESDQPHDTYYVYDDHGNLGFVLPPLMEATTTAIGTLITNMPDLGYRYVYDLRNRLVEKQIPGKDKEYIIYNKVDQPIMTQDANQRISGEWLFTKYDAFGRVAYTGKAVDNRERNLIQTDVDALTGVTWVAKDNTFNMDGITVGYANTIYPTTTVTEVLTVNYYDDYSFGPTTGTGVTAFGLASTDLTHGLATGSRVKVLDVSPAKWITSTTYYDDKARPIYAHANNAYLETVDIIESKLDFVGRVTQARTAHTRAGTTTATLENFTYDHVGRLLSQTQCIGDQTLGYTCNGTVVDANITLQGTTVTTDQVASNGITVSPVTTISGDVTLRIGGSSGQEELIVYNDYDELGQMTAKKVGSTPGADYTGTTGLQTVDYAYNVRGWLEAINDTNEADSNLSLDANDLWGFKIKYNDIADATKKLYNGNISQTLWDSKSTNTSGNPVSNTYTYTYDALNRINTAVDNTGNYGLGLVTYDKNGNIERLTRNGHREVNVTNFGLMDDLTYAYTGNQLQAVDDANTSSALTGFIDGVEETTEYTYDANGNMLTDDNKGITGITYNHLNLPTSISINGNGNNGSIDYIYDATGVKLKKVTTEGGSLTTTDYAGNYIYENGNLQFFNQPEGYVTPSAVEGYDYVYQYKDHLGNVRLSYADSNNDGSIDASTEIISEKNYYPFGLEHKGYNNVVSPNANGTAEKFKYNGIELEESLGLNLYEMDFRQYDPAIGRFTSIDPVIHFDYSTYSAFDNNPAYWADPSGANATDLINDIFNAAGSGKTTFTNNGDGTFSGSNGTTVDCDECKKTEEKLNAANGKLLEINNKLSDALRFQSFAEQFSLESAVRGLLLEIALDLKNLPEEDLDKIISRLVLGKSTSDLVDFVNEYKSHLREKGLSPNTVSENELNEKLGSLASGVKDRIGLILNLASPHVRTATGGINQAAKLNVKILERQQKTTMQQQAALEKSLERLYNENGISRPAFKGGFGGGSLSGGGASGDFK